MNGAIEHGHGGWAARICQRGLRLGLPALLLYAAPAHAEVLWQGDFETGDASQWSYQLNPEGLSVVTAPDPVLEGAHAARVELSTANRWQESSMYRVELQRKLDGERGLEGTETYFGWSVYLPEPLPAGDYQLGYFETDVTYDQVLSLHARGADLSLFLNHQGGAPWQGPGLLQTGTWHRLVYHVVWSADPAAGAVSLWVDGVKWVDARPARTFVDDQPAFIQLGLFSNSAPSETTTIYVDAAMEGESYEDVALGIPESAAPPPMAPSEPPPSAGGGAGVAGAPSMPSGVQAGGDSGSEGGCRVAPASSSRPSWPWLSGLLGLLLLRRRRSR